MSKVEEHEHTWITDTRDSTQKKCMFPGCRAVLMSRFEYDRRLEIWAKYRESLRQTPAYIGFQSLKPYMRFLGNEMGEQEKKEVQEILNAMDEHYQKNDYIVKPNFVEPDLPFLTIIFPEDGS